MKLTPLWTLTVAVLVTVTVAASAAEPIVTLIARERAGVARTNEPITGGVPLPRGLVKDADDLALRDGSGKPVPAQFDVLNRWPGDKSIRWVLVNTTVSAAANGGAKLLLVRGKATQPAGLKVVKQAGRITVDTGALRFSVKTQGGFTGVHEAHLGAEQVISPSPHGLYMRMDGDLYSSALDRGAKVVVESQGPQTVVIKAAGQMVSASGAKGFHYIVRIHAYAGSARLRIVPVVRRMYGNRDSTSKVADLGFEFSTPPAAARRFAIGGDKSISAGAIAPGQSAAITYSTSDRYNMSGLASGSGRGKSTKPLAVGWAGVSGDRVGLAAGVRYFWQTFPKAVSVSRTDAGGRLTVHLVSAKGKPLVIFSGMARSHEILVLPHAARPARELQSVFVGHQLPLRPFAPVQWNCASGAFGSIAPAGRAPYGRFAGNVATWDRTMADLYKRLMSDRDLWRKRGVTMDAYGFLGFGDTLHWVWSQEPKTSPWAIAWDANYYDKPLMMLLFWARTGHGKLFDFFDVSSWHLMDIDVIHYHRGFDECAGSRRCPATNHVGFDPPNHRQAVGNFGFDHHKSESLFYRYYMTGDRWSLRVAQGLAKWAYKSKDQSQRRNFAHQMNSLLAAWNHTADRKWLQRAQKLFNAMVNRHAKGWPKGDFYNGLMMEAIAKYYYASGDRNAIEALAGYCDHHIANGFKYANMAYGYAVVWKETGKDKYLQAALANMNHGRPGHIGKDMPMHYRSTAWVTGILSAGSRGR